MHQPPTNRRILVIDDNRAIHTDFRKILGPTTAPSQSMLDDEEILFGAGTPQTATTTAYHCEIDSASQGEEGLALVQKSVAEGRPYAMAFVDVRMPPGWDGIETTRRIWDVCPDLQIVICTAYSDCSWEQMQKEINPRDRLLILKKPFDTVEVLQLANALIEKWRLLEVSKSQMHDLEKRVHLRTLELEEAREAAMKMMEQAVINREKERQAAEVLRLEMEEHGRLEKRFRDQAALLDKTRDAIVVRDLEHRITYWNKGAERIYGWTASEVIGRKIPELLHRDATQSERACDAVIQQGEWNGELQEVGKSGTPLLVDGRYTLLRDPAGRPQGILAINTDITEKKKLEQQFLRAQRMDSIGTLAGGIAHDLNNALTPILMSIELLKLQEKDARRIPVLQNMESSAKRGASMVRQLLSFASGVEGRQLAVQVSHLLKEIEKFANETFLKTIQVRSDIPADLWTVQGDPTQLHQVLLNLCVNARDAMSGSGTLKISASNMTIDEHYVRLNGEGKPGSYIVIHVEDSGTGMPPEVIERIFEPFFTTKELGKGTGLGLSTSLGIIKNHGGFVRVCSEMGKGSRFSVHLPSLNAAESEQPAPARTELPVGNGQLLLVVDDEADVRQITRHTLEAFNYRVLLAGDGSEAVKLYSTQQQDISAVVTDMMMPVMDGPAAIREMVRINPQVRIIAASGLNANGMEARAITAGVKHFIPKPYTAETMLKTLHTMLAA